MIEGLSKDSGIIKGIMVVHNPLYNKALFLGGEWHYPT